MYMPVGSPLPLLQVRKSLAVIQFLGWLIERMAELATIGCQWHQIISEASSSTWPLNHSCSVYSCYRVGPAITFRAVDTQIIHIYKGCAWLASLAHSLYYV